jgi:hypothetical protein
MEEEPNHTTAILCKSFNTLCGNTTAFYQNIDKLDDRQILSSKETTEKINIIEETTGGKGADTKV